MSDEAKFRIQPFTLLSIGIRVGRVVTFDKKLLPLAGKFEICYHATKKFTCLLTVILGPI